MNVWQRILRFSVLGGTLGMLTACSLTGWWQYGYFGYPADVKSSGWKRHVPGASAGATCWIVGSQCLSGSGAATYDGNASGAVKKVRTNDIYHNLGSQCPWDASVCNGIMIASTEGKVRVITTDTSGDGYISAAPDFPAIGGPINACGATAVALAWYETTGNGMPFSGLWQDANSCPFGPEPSALGMSSALTDVTTAYGGGGWGIVDQDPGGTNSWMMQLPLEVKQDLLNSIEASDITTQGMAQTVKVQITNVRMGGRSYRPVGVYLNLFNFQALKLDLSKEPGLKIMLAWMANQIEQGLDRGVKDFRWGIELNGAATITSDMLPKNAVLAPFTASTVQAFRTLATSNLRSE